MHRYSCISTIAAATLLCLCASGETYRYDSMGRLVQVVYSSGVQTTYTYDANCNRIGEATAVTHWADVDSNEDNQVSLAELLRMVQFYNADALHCDGLTEDGFAPGAGAQDCTHHSGDYAPADWVMSLSELLRAVQYFNSPGYAWCPSGPGEDGFCPGLS